MTHSVPRIIVGLDYGTTYTAVAFTNSQEPSLNSIELIKSWPGSWEIASKVPSRIAYARENHAIDADAWGYAVTSTMDSYSWTKLLLNRHMTMTDFDDPSLKSFFGTGMLRLPGDKSAQEIVQDFLTHVYQFTERYLARKLSAETIKEARFDFWITVPAIWNDRARQLAKDAARAAGFGKRPCDNVHLITEPEAAALAALKPHLDPQAIDAIVPGENILVCDCGGGTVDIMTYGIVEVSPRLTFKELCVGTGGKVGSTYVDRNFVNWLTKTFGKFYTEIPVRKRDPGSALMRSFEATKRNFGSNMLTGHVKTDFKVEHLEMTRRSDTRFDSKEHVLTLTFDELKSFFDPVIDKIVALLDSQIARARESSNVINRLILVGGFGDSDYLAERIKTWCDQQKPFNIKLTCPPQCEAAIARGAALRGLEELRPVSRIARRFYGYELAMPFRKDIDPEEISFIDEFDDTKRCPFRIKWVINKGQNISDDTHVEFAVQQNFQDEYDEFSSHCSLNICSFSGEIPPDFSFAQGVEILGSIVTEFSITDFLKAPKRTNEGSPSIRLFSYRINMSFSVNDGSLAFDTNFDGKKAGHTKINFHET